MTQYDELPDHIEVDGVQIADPMMADFFRAGVRHIRVEAQPDGSRKFFSEKGQAHPAEEIVKERDEPDLHTVFNAGLITKEEAVKRLNEGFGPMSFDEEKNQVDRIADLKEWWIQDAADRVNMVAEKAVTYGSDSLTELGRTLAKLQGRTGLSDEELQEIGIWSYVVGKVGRWTDAMIRGERVKEDTITDIIAYATMAARVRQAGGWPDSQG